MKILSFLTIMSLSVVFWSCTKEDSYLPEDHQEATTETTNFRYTLQKCMVESRVERKTVPFEQLHSNSVVYFKEHYWSITYRIEVAEDGWESARSEVWISKNGKDWKLRASPQFSGRFGHSLIVNDNKIWMIGGMSPVDALPELSAEVWYSGNGENWVQNSNAPFQPDQSNGAVVFQNKIFVFEYGLNENRGSQRVFSSTDGRNWTLVNKNAFPSASEGKAIGFNKHIYFIGGRNFDTGISDKIWKSSNGQNWELVETRTSGCVRSDFLPRYAHAIVVHNGQVWLVGGKTTDGTQNDIWHSKDMVNWQGVYANPRIPSLFGHTLISTNNDILILGGQSQPDPLLAADPFQQIWSLTTN
ncbi:Kelch repeat-containing protein [Kriegella aquimaris]|uniref:Kelch motif-containing protein n=1 Tax=Kriegella aquimaris TaxID=192904 RepID=A0A1G9UWS6_9FLAO|nr:hypothetical protein [Kriegella aquimaris]SDM64404.1 Kelch motif-containing protein [Kriegella aquimaris]